ncbi:MAG: phosphotransferase [Flavobacteriales bacterium]|nr:phosphotransferase [Flavobacteriales bacterium]
MSKIILKNDTGFLQGFLADRNWLQEGESLIGTEIPGDGNMNFTLRLITDQRTVIIKQSRDHIEKYPAVPAPTDRALREAEFYELIATCRSLRQKMPKLLGVDRKNHVLLLEDLGDESDYSSLYREGEQIATKEIKELANFLSTLHLNFHRETSPNRIRNTAMRKLNHQHIFILPYQKENGFDLDSVLPGLSDASMDVKTDSKISTSIKELGEIYLRDGDHLLHGDFFPGSWLNTKGGIRIIDPEFCFFGPAEFETGVTLAHLKMADQTHAIQKQWVEMYMKHAPLEKELCEKFAAVEVIRRLIGLAQLPLDINLEKRIELLENAREILAA